MSWLELKFWIEQVTGLDRDALHIYIALLIQLGLAVFFRKRLASIWPWLAVLVIELINEYMDYRDYWVDNSLPEQFHDGLYKDIWNTMLAPSLLLLIANIWPGWLVQKEKVDIEKPESGDVNSENEV